LKERKGMGLDRTGWFTEITIGNKRIYCLQ